MPAVQVQSVIFMLNDRISVDDYVITVNDVAQADFFDR
jgi:hypothetical protein